MYDRCFYTILISIVLNSVAQGVAFEQQWQVNPSPIAPSGPIAVLKDDGIFKAWHDNLPAIQILYSESNDGINWGSATGVYNPSGTNDNRPEVVKANGQYNLWAGDSGTGAGPIAAQSSDGLNWQTIGLLGNAGHDFGTYSMLPEDNGFKAWYRTRSDPWNYRLATSADGLNWQDQGAILNGGPNTSLSDLDVIKVGNSYHMWYSANANSSTGRIAYASSDDGVNWAKHGFVEGFEAYTNRSVIGHSVMVDDNKLKMWFHHDSTGKDYYAESLLTLPITIDIKPGSDPNSINLGSQGVIPVALLGSDVFSVLDVDQTTAQFEGAFALARGKSGKIGTLDDVNDDGFMDLMLRFDTQELVVDDDVTEMILTGLLLNGTPFEGLDSVNIVPPSTATTLPLMTANVPEPTTLALLGISGMAVLRRRKK